MEQQVALTALFGLSTRATEDVLRRLTSQAANVVVPVGTVVPAHVPVIHTVPAVAERSLGCPCCRVRLDLHRAVPRLLARRRPPAGVVVVGDRHTDPGPMLASLLCDPLLARRAHLDAAVVAVDAAEASVRLVTGQPLPPTAEAEEQLALADAVVITGAGALTAPALAAVKEAVQALNPFASLATPHPGAGSLPWPAGGDAYTLGPVANRLDGLSPCCGSGGGAVLIDLDGNAEVAGLHGWIHSLVRTYGADLLRLQAVCSLAGRPERWACSAVRSFYQAGLVGASERGRQGVRVLAVGRGLDRHELAASLRPVLSGRP